MHNHLELYIHYVWATWDRHPLIEADWEEVLYSKIVHEAQSLGCYVRALGGVEDHVHLLVRIPATHSIALLIKQIKGPSSLFVNDSIRPNLSFKWQGGYAAFTVSRWDVPKIANYIERQKEHHAQGTTKASLELAAEHEFED